MVVGSIPTRGYEIFLIPRSGNKTKRGVSFRCSIRDVSKIESCMRDGVSEHWVPSLPILLCGIQQEVGKKNVKLNGTYVQVNFYIYIIVKNVCMYIILTL